MRAVCPPGRVFRDPATKQLVPEKGIEIELNNLDHARALRDGDLVEVEETTAKPGKGAGEGDQK